MSTHTLNATTAADISTKAIAAFKLVTGKTPTDDQAAMIAAMTLGTLFASIAVLNIEIDVAPSLSIYDNQFSLFSFE
jgi:hypothetical protein